MKILAATLALLLCATPAMAKDVYGLWRTASGTGLVKVADCGPDYADGTMAGTPCGTIFSAAIPEGAPVTDTNNPNPNLRDQPLIGLTMLDGFEVAKNGAWKRGRIYNPEDGKSYKSRISVDEDDPNILKVKGCVGPFCQTQRWTREEAQPASATP